MTTSTKITSVNPFLALTWGQRLQIITDFRVDFQTAATIMEVTVSDLEQASQNTIADVTFDTAEYSSYFKTSSLPTSTVQAQASTPAKKRGRKTSKIRDAFNAITTTPQPLYDFCLAHDVSEHCMRQHSRFAPDRTDIVIRKPKGENTVPMIWSQPVVAVVAETTSTTNINQTIEADANLIAASSTSSSEIELTV